MIKIEMGRHTVSFEFTVGEWLIKLEGWDLKDWQSMEVLESGENIPRGTHHARCAVQMHNSKGEGVEAFDLLDARKLSTIFEIAKMNIKSTKLMEKVLRGYGLYDEEDKCQPK